MFVNDFYKLVSDNLYNHPEWRYGQTLFNTLHQVYPTTADSIRGTDRDPFYATSADDASIARFWVWFGSVMEENDN